MSQISDLVFEVTKKDVNSAVESRVGIKIKLFLELWEPDSILSLKNRLRSVGIGESEID